VATEETILRGDRDEISVISVLRVAWRYNYLIAAVATVCAAIAVVLALTATLIYRAEIVVTHTASSANGLGGLARQFSGLAGIAGINLKNDGTEEAQAVLRSRHLSEQFVRANDLTATLLANSDKNTLWYAVDRFREKVLSIREDKDEGTTTIAVQWTDPVVAARWANDYVALANEIMRTRALDESSRNIKYLEDQIAKTNVVELQRVMYQVVEDETKTHMLANVRKEYAFAIVDPAVPPEKRVWPKRSLMVLTGAVLGIVLGTLLALVLNMWKQHRPSR
jgi:uncharacterized protein involved in exopolysaccharide biosynthesis